MTHFTTSKGNFIAVQKHDNAIDFKLDNALGNSVLSYRYDNIDDLAFIPLPGGEYEIIGLSSDILKDEELAKKVVDKFSIETLFEGNNITGNQLIIKKT